MHWQIGKVLRDFWFISNKEMGITIFTKSNLVTSCSLNKNYYPKVTSKITKTVCSGITKTTEVKCSLQYYVDKILFKEHIMKEL